MASRRTSLSDYADLAIAREVDSKYDDVRIVADNIDKVIIVADNIENIDALKLISEDITTVANIHGEVTNLSNISTSIVALHDDIDVLNSLYTDKVVLDSIFADKYKLDSIYADKTAIDSVYADKTTIDGVFENLVSINAVYSDLAAINTVYTSVDNVDTVALNITEVNIVSSNIDSVINVATNEIPINIVSTNILDVGIVATNVGSLNSVSTNITSVLTVSDNIADVNVVSTNVADIINVSEQIVPNLPEILMVDSLAAQVATDTIEVTTMKLAVESMYNSFDSKFLGAKLEDPLLDNDGNTLIDGALYFNTSSNSLKVYDAGNTVWLVIPQLYLSSLLDVELVSISSGDVLLWDGAKWVNTSLQDSITNNSDVQANTNARHTHNNKLLLDVIDQNLNTLGTPSFYSVQLNNGTGTQGLFEWDTDNETATLSLGNYTYPLGQALPIHCTKYNGANSITKGRPVIAMGTTGGSGKIMIAEATLANWQLKDPSATEVPAKYVLGVAAENITNNGVVVCFGKVSSIIGTTFTQGTVYYVDEINGGFTAVRPTSGLVMPIAFAINSNTLMVRITPINELAIDKGVEAYNEVILIGTYTDFETAFNIAESN